MGGGGGEVIKSLGAKLSRALISVILLFLITSVIWGLTFKGALSFPSGSMILETPNKGLIYQVSVPGNSFRLR